MRKEKSKLPKMHLFSLLYKRRRLVLSKTLGLNRMRKFCWNKKLTINIWNDLKNGWKKSCNINFAFEIWFCRPKWVECGSETSFIEHVCKFKFCFEKGLFSHPKELRWTSQKILIIRNVNHSGVKFFRFAVDKDVI